MSSLTKAIDTAHEGCVILFGDVLFKKYVLSILLDDLSDIVIIVDSVFSLEKKYQSDFVHASTMESKSLFHEDNFYLEKIVYGQPGTEYYGEWPGMVKLTMEGSEIVKAFIQEFRNKPEFQKMNIRNMLNQLVQRGNKIKIQTISGHRIDVNNIDDFSLTGGF
jgi:phosphoenolpyruvate phosphomutase